MPLRDHHVPAFAPVADPDAVVAGADYRFTVLTDRLLRLEYDPGGGFENRPSQAVWYRELPVPEFTVRETGGTLVVETEALRLRHETGEGFTPETLSVEVFETGETWRYGDEGGDLGGTVATLDQVDGPTELDPGLCSRAGWAVFDDGDSLVFGEDGWLHRREAPGAEDLYLFGHGTDYRGVLADLAAVTGAPPIPPRWALGNWWSRYWAYDDAELLGVVEGFRERDLPLSVCVVDMDWHVVDNEYHDGWTGFSWNRDLFPDPDAFLDALHETGVKTTLNLHPAQGVHPHEDAYDRLAERLGVAAGAIPFDASDPEFLTAYFEELLHPLEEAGVDFWWVDWQQWRDSPQLPGLDPLWALNHLHAHDRARDGRRPFLLSRWSGVGGHRYPVGFSGDTVASWDSLAFQPPFTATAANVDCGWWSHDIGGHYGGSGSPEADGELYARWVQYGLFSPVLRIHSTNAPYLDRRPWRFGAEASEVIGNVLRERHALVPYLYTLARRYHETGVPFTRPLYYDHEAEPAYAAPGAYYFGEALLVAPHLRPRDDETGLARTAVWLPGPGVGGPERWFDFHTGEPRQPGWHVRYGDLADLPVYARAGALVPLGPEVGWGGIDPPEHLRVVVFPGADGAFDLYEDDGETTAYRDGAFATTPIRSSWTDDELVLSVGPSEGATGFVPENRTVAFHVRGLDPTGVSVEADTEVEVDTHGTLVVTLPALPEAGATVTVSAADGSLDLLSPRSTADRVRSLLWHADLWVHTKPDVEAALRESGWNALAVLPNFQAVLPDGVARALVEVCHDVGVDHRTDEHDRLVLWNAEGRPDVRYRFSAWHPGGHPAEHDTAEQAVVPAFETIDLADYQGMAWELEVEYGDVTVVRYEGEGV